MEESWENMPRRAREKSESGIYHIILRGANKQEIFHDEEDCIKFLEILQKYKVTSSIKVHGWCLMGNHVHILIEQGMEDLSATMKRIGVSYAWYYNCKYKSTGHLFQDRYRSEKVEKDTYLLTVIRYIHQNPIKAGIVKRMPDWKWSSCNSYYGKDSYPVGLLDNKLVLSMLSENMEIAVKRFVEFNETENEFKCLDEDKIGRLTDEEAKLEISRIIPLSDIALIKSMPKVQRDNIVSKIKAIEKLTQRQAARILGVPPNLIFRT